VPCVESVTSEGTHVEPCSPQAQGDEVKPPPSWGLVAQQCIVEPVPRLDCDTGQACAPSLSEGFRLCLYMKGDRPEVPCPAPDYPERFVVYAAPVQDTRGCSPCTCGEPEGADCAAYVSIFTDSACGAPVGAATPTLDDPACVDIPSGSALGSKSASLVVDKPGTCAPSGGEFVGDVTPVGPMTLCCTPEAKGSK
jgi:hypothetical protein